MTRQEYFDRMDAEQKDIDIRCMHTTHEDTRLGLGWI